MTRGELAGWREHLPITQNHAYLDHAAVGPLPRETMTAVAKAAEAQAADGSGAYGRLEQEAEVVREEFADLIGALPTEVAFAKNTSTALSTVAGGLAWQAGDSVVLSEIEFPANVFPWLNLSTLGVHVRRIPAPAGRVRVDDLLAAVDSKTRVVAVSLVQFSNGYRANLEALSGACRARKILLVVDAMQAVGALSLDVHGLGVDVLATASNKWLLGPFGVGWLYVRADLIEKVRPQAVGIYSVTPRTSYFDHTFTLRDGARRFENGVPNFTGISGFGASVRFLKSAGLRKIEGRILELTDRLAGGLASRGYTVLSPREKPDECSGIVTFRSSRHATEALQERLAAAKVVVSSREGALRVSPHFYNTGEEIDQLLEALPA